MCVFIPIDGKCHIGTRGLMVFGLVYTSDGMLGT